MTADHERIGTIQFFDITVCEEIDLTFIEIVDCFGVFDDQPLREIMEEQCLQSFSGVANRNA